MFCYNKSTKCKNLGKHLSYCNRNHAIINNHSPCVMFVYTDHIISFLKKFRSTLFTESMKMAIPQNAVDTALLTVKVVRKKCIKVDTIQNKEE